MAESAKGEIFSLKCFRDKLKEKYRSDVFFIPGNGRNSELICFRNFTEFILRRINDKNKTKESIIKTAATLIKKDILAMECLQVLKWSSLNEELEEKYGFEPNHWGVVYKKQQAYTHYD